MESPLRVLIVDPLDESREVLRTALARRGWEILEARRAGDGMALARRHHPDVVVLDTEMEHSESEAVSFSDEFVSSSDVSRGRYIFLGKLQRRTDAATDDQVVPKPYHYAALIRRIEQMRVAA